MKTFMVCVLLLAALATAYGQGIPPQARRLIQSIGVEIHAPNAAPQPVPTPTRRQLVQVAYPGCATITQNYTSDIRIATDRQACTPKAYVDLVNGSATYTAVECDSKLGLRCRNYWLLCRVGESGGSVCAHDSECASGNCVSGTCSLDNGVGGKCEADYDCTTHASTCVNGRCSGTAPGQSCSRRSQCIGGYFCKTPAATCQAEESVGASCSQPFQCGSGAMCASGTCYRLGETPNDSRFLRLTSAYVSHPISVDLQTAFSMLCASGYVDTDGYCRAPPSGGLAIGSPCNLTKECAFDSSCVCNGFGSGTCTRNFTSTVKSVPLFKDWGQCLERNRCGSWDCPACEGVTTRDFCSSKEISTTNPVLAWEINVFPTSLQAVTTDLIHNLSCTNAAGTAAPSALLAALVVIAAASLLVL